MIEGAIILLFGIGITWLMCLCVAEAKEEKRRRKLEALQNGIEGSIRWRRKPKL